MESSKINQQERSIMNVESCKSYIRQIFQDEVWDIRIDEPEPGSNKATGRMVYDDVLPPLEVEVYDRNPQPFIDLPGGKKFEVQTTAKCWVCIPNTEMVFPIGAEGGSQYLLSYLEDYRKKNHKEVA